MPSEKRLEVKKKKKLPGVAVAGNGLRGALASRPEAGSPFNLFVTSLPESDSSMLPGMFLIVAFPMEVFITLQWQQIVSIKGSFSHYFQEAFFRSFFFF